ncbi:hypothetical protein PHMEG_00021971 [Phytophthora megakarya]|uniref:Reverse transcriptase domain-containing protein n=1 Tax=Phytophthora megakarya TaxID=4795 RepID=A0A225VKC4_9STRA|nr:hypothetical protein PHMEG_00021971 [Phytophthora megakarya]
MGIIFLFLVWKSSENGMEIIRRLGHFQRNRMPFGLKNAPLIYQQMLDNCLCLGILGIKSENKDLTVFRRNIPAPAELRPVLRRSSYIDDIAYGGETWDQMCIDLDRLFYRLRYWGISVSLPKSEFGKRTISFLSHEIGTEGIRAKPKSEKGVKNLPLPTTYKGVQSFLGSLNYYNKFIGDPSVVAAVLYELTDDRTFSLLNLQSPLSSKNLNSTFSGIAISSVVALVAFTSRVNAHGFIDQPNGPTHNGHDSNAWLESDFELIERNGSLSSYTQILGRLQDCVGIGNNVYRNEGRTRIKVTLTGSLVYFFDIWVGDLTDQHTILGMDFMILDGIRLDLAHGSISLPTELISDKAKIVNVGQYLRIQAGELVELPLRLRSSIHDKLWVTHGDQWVPTISDGPGRTKYISITNVGDEALPLHQDQRIGIWLVGDHVP